MGSEAASFLASSPIGVKPGGRPAITAGRGGSSAFRGDSEGLWSAWGGAEAFAAVRQAGVWGSVVGLTGETMVGMSLPDGPDGPHAGVPGAGLPGAPNWPGTLAPNWPGAGSWPQAGWGPGAAGPLGFHAGWPPEPSGAGPVPHGGW